MTKYQLTADCAYVTSDTPYGRAKTLVYKGFFIPADSPELKHLLDSGLAEKVGDDASAGPNSEGGLGPAETPSVEVVDEDEQKRVDARTKLDELGGTPDGRSSEAVWVEYAVRQGMDRAEAEKAGRAELKKHFDSLSK